jgi:UDP-N-acetylmuramyl pentapeptide phosphotransferase/UDP-N-acetylglucosamine-1-phosphate transferase
VGWALSLLWIVAAINFFNFMDGIDGLATGQAAASCLGVVAAAWSTDASALSLAAGAACLGFLYHNAPPARVFMGDSGSGFLGFLLAAIPFLAPAPRRSDALLAVAIGLTLFLVDPVVTLVRRALARKNVLRAHREHLYQQLVAPDEPAGRVTAAYTAAAVLLALLGAYGYRSPSMFWVGCAGGAVASYAVWHRARLATRARSSQRPVTG